MNRDLFSAALILILFFAGAASVQGQQSRVPYPPRGWQPGPVVASAFHIEWRQWPAGYAIQLYLPDRRTADVQISVEGHHLRIYSVGEKRLTAGGGKGPVLMQFGGFSQWVALPPDADMGRMKLASNGGTIRIFIPKRRQRVPEHP